MEVLIISGSLHPASRSRLLARHLTEVFDSMQVEAQMIDLRDIDMPLCDGTGEGKTLDVTRLAAEITNAAAIVVASPVYNFDVNAVIKNTVELTGRAWADKPVGFLCSAGGRSSYMAVMGLANSLMLDFRCLIAPRSVFATKSDFGDDKLDGMHISSEEIKERIAELAQMMVRLARI